MDPQKLSQLDPKLRDAYQRVMGTVIPEPQIPAAQEQTPPAETTTEPVSEPIKPPVSEPQSTPLQQPSNFVQMNSEAAVPTQTETVIPAATPNFTAPAAFGAVPAQNQTMVIKKKGNPLMLVLITIVILVFLVVYGLFWIKIFNLNLPFLP